MTRTLKQIHDNPFKVLFFNNVKQYPDVQPSKMNQSFTKEGVKEAVKSIKMEKLLKLMISSRTNEIHIINNITKYTHKSSSIAIWEVYNKIQFRL